MQKQLKILIIGGGGREHALAWKAAQSPLVQQVWVAPGNAGTARENKVQNIPIAVDDIDGLLAFALQEQIDLTIVGPEASLAAGITDSFLAAKLTCFGPTQQAAQLETSKIFSKRFMKEHQIPTARYAAFSHCEEALLYARAHSLPMVIKANGLASGKGVIIAHTQADAEAAIIDMMENKIFGEAGEQLIIEEFLQGSEMSFIIMTDGLHILPLASSKDHKRRDNHDQGPNTGGMGAYSPAPQLTDSLEKDIINNVIEPTVNAFARSGAPYIGFLYAGLMITPEGEPKVLEFNCRLGDPETQPILMRLKSDLIEMCLAATKGKLDQIKAQWDDRPALSVILASAGYPATFSIGEIIPHIDSPVPENCKIFHAATQKNNHNIVTSGGRVLAVTAIGEDLQVAREEAYNAVKKVAWANCHYRTDIGCN